MSLSDVARSSMPLTGSWVSLRAGRGGGVWVQRRVPRREHQVVSRSGGVVDAVSAAAGRPAP